MHRSLSSLVIDPAAPCAVSLELRPKTLAGLLQARAFAEPDREAYLFLADGEVEAERLTWGELDGRARAIATALRESIPAGERALLLFAPGLEFIAAFFGCLYAGVIAVPGFGIVDLAPGAGAVGTGKSGCGRSRGTRRRAPS
jgi:non-ribosomal peptide synthetase component F